VDLPQVDAMATSLGQSSGKNFLVGTPAFLQRDREVDVSTT